MSVLRRVPGTIRAEAITTTQRRGPRSRRRRRRPSVLGSLHWRSSRHRTTGGRGPPPPRTLRSPRLCRTAPPRAGPSFEGGRSPSADRRTFDPGSPVTTPVDDQRRPRKAAKGVPLVQGVALRVEPRYVRVASMPSELGEEPALADPRFADHGDRSSSPSLHAVDHARELSDLIAASDERDVQIHRSLSAAQRDRSLDDVALPLQLESRRRTPQACFRPAGAWSPDRRARFRSPPAVWSRAAIFTASPVAPISSRLPPPTGADHHDPGLDPDPHAEGIDPGAPRDGSGVMQRRRVGSPSPREPRARDRLRVHSERRTTPGCRLRPGP